MAPFQRLSPSRGGCGSSSMYFSERCFEASSEYTDGDLQQLDCLRVDNKGRILHFNVFFLPLKVFDFTLQGRRRDYVFTIFLYSSLSPWHACLLPGEPQGLRQAKFSITHFFTSVDSSQRHKLSLDLDLQATMFRLAQVYGIVALRSLVAGGVSRLGIHEARRCFDGSRLPSYHLDCDKGERPRHGVKEFVGGDLECSRSY